MDKILLFSAIRKDYRIVELFLESIKNLECQGFELDYLIYDDNEDEKASNLINEFIRDNDTSTLLSDLKIKGNYTGDHNWDEKQIEKIIQIKNRAMKYALEYNYDYVFLVDADIIMNADTLKFLYSLKKNIVAEVFWTKFYGESYYKPNAWDYHSWSYTSAKSILQYKEKNTYNVGCTGACTLISVTVIKKGVSFSKLKNMPYSGEDRHFCTRALSCGFQLYLDTHYPAYHIFDEKQIYECREWFKNGAKAEFFKKWIDDKWEKKVIEAYYKKDDFFSKLKLFFYLIRKSYRNVFGNN